MIALSRIFLFYTFLTWHIYTGNFTTFTLFLEPLSINDGKYISSDKTKHLNYVEYCYLNTHDLQCHNSDKCQKVSMTQMFLPATYDTWKVAWYKSSRKCLPFSHNYSYWPERVHTDCSRFNCFKVSLE